MATVISTINMKGGVGKTTIAMAIAEIMSGDFGKKVLVIDLDPQTNATTALIGEDKWKDLNASGHTLAQLFKDALEPEHRRFDLQRTRQKRVSNVDAVRSVDLLPSSLDLIDIQDRLASMPIGKFYAGSPTDVLRKATRPIIDDYDVVLIDCPPNLGIITLNGLRMSNAYIIPTIPDVLSTYGIPQIVTRVGEFSKEIEEPIEPLGIAISKFREQSTVHQNMVRQLRKHGDVPVFEAKIPEDNDITGAPEFKPISTLRQKWGYRRGYQAFRSLTEEVLVKVDADEHAAAS